MWCKTCGVIKAIIFDCFGVLVGHGFKETYRQAGGDPARDKQFIDDLLGAANMGYITSEEMSQKITEKIGITNRQWQAVVAKAELPHEELLEYVKDLKPKYKVAILSNANAGTLQRKLNPKQLALFDTVVVSAEVGMIKPDPHIYEYTADQLGVRPDECVFVDDISSYVEAATAVGMQGIHYQDFSQLKTELDKILY